MSFAYDTAYALRLEIIELERENAVLKRKLDKIYERAAELSGRLDEGDAAADDLINFVDALARKEDV